MPYQNGTYQSCGGSGFRSKKKSLSKSPEPETSEPAETPTPEKEISQANATPPPSEKIVEEKKETPNIRPVTPVREIRSTERPRKIARIPRLDELAEAGRKKEEKKSEEESQELYGEDPFTADELRESWNAFADQKKKAGRDVEYAILTQDYYLKEKHTIVLQLTNTVKINILDRFRSDLITYLKQNLNNRHIQIETELLEEEKAYRPYTNKEKFEYLVTKKPILKDLQERLGLDPDL